MREAQRPSVLLALAGDRRAEEVDEMVAFARSRSAHVHLLHVLDRKAAGPAADPKPFLREALERFRAAGVEVDALERKASGRGVGHDIAAAAREAMVDLVALPSRGVGDVEAILRGSVSHQLLAATDRPVLLSRGRSGGPAPRRILVATDGGDLDRLEAALAEVAVPGSEVIVLHVPEIAATLDLPWVEPADRALETAREVAGALRRSGFDTTPEVRWGPVAYTIVETAAARHCDLIVLGSRPPSDLVALLTGSVAQQVIQSSDRPVLLAATPAKRRPSPAAAVAVQNR